MLRKLVATWVLILAVAFSSISIYATDGGTATGTEGIVGTTSSEQGADANTAQEGTTISAVDVTGAAVENLLVTENAVGTTSDGAINQADDEEEPELTAKEKAALEKAKKAEKYKKGLAAFIRKENKNISKKKSLEYAGYFIKYGDRYNIDEKLVMAMADRESNFRASSFNPAGYYGMLQLNPNIAKKNGYKLSSMFKAWVNIKCGSRYLSDLIRIMGSRNKGIAAYMYGSGNVSAGRWSMTPVNKILKTRDEINRYLKKYNYI
ncbi:MAG TPA: transglycosylase SLT domain-containing protein [Anaerovoracaceae bacterium]|nr:transglycosylase SLT domain-containing protein [Anaerovoracaceae bacterium]